MKPLIPIILILMLTGCVSTTKVNWTKPQEVEITGASDELITFEGDGIKVTADRRGKPNVFQSLIGLMMMKGMDTEVKE